MGVRLVRRPGTGGCLVGTETWCRWVLGWYGDLVQVGVRLVRRPGVGGCWVCMATWYKWVLGWYGDLV